MNVFQKWRRNWARQVLKNAVQENTTWQTLADFLGVDLNAAVSVRGASALVEATVYTCIKLLSEGLGKLPTEVYQNQGNGIEKASNHYLYPILHLRPNPYMTAMAFWQALETQRNLYGNSYAWIDRATIGRNSGQVKGLYPIPAEHVQIWVDNEGLVSSKDSIWFIYYDRSGVSHKIQSDDMLHFRGMSLDGISGISPIEKLNTIIENGASAQSFMNSSLKGGMQAAGIVHYVGDLGEPEKEKFRTKFEAMASGLKNANRIAMLPVGFQYQPLELKLTDAQFVENTQLIYRQISAAFGVKAHQLNDLVKTSYASASEANSEFYTDTLLPILTMYEQETTYKLFTTPEVNKGLYTKFDVDMILRADKKTRYETYAQGIDHGFLKPNEARDREGLPKDPGGDRLFMNGNIVPIDQAGAAYQKGGGTTSET
jgi:HK97 family phage portal protein